MVLEGYTRVKLFGVAKTAHMSWLNNWTSENDAIVVADDVPYPNWSNWDANQRDLYLLNHEMQIVFNENITNGLNEEIVYTTVVDLISEIPDNEILGDVNGDGILNVIDIVLMVNIILDNEYNLAADVNEDGLVNIVDVVMMVNILVGGLP